MRGSDGGEEFAPLPSPAFLTAFGKNSGRDRHSFSHFDELPLPSSLQLQRVYSEPQSRTWEQEGTPLKVARTSDNVSPRGSFSSRDLPFSDNNTVKQSNNSELQKPAVGSSHVLGPSAELTPMPQTRRTGALVGVRVQCKGLRSRRSSALVPPTPPNSLLPPSAQQQASNLFPPQGNRIGPFGYLGPDGPFANVMFPAAGTDIR